VRRVKGLGKGKGKGFAGRLLSASEPLLVRLA